MLRRIAAAGRQGSGHMPGRYRMALITGATSGIGAAFAAASTSWGGAPVFDEAISDPRKRRSS